MKAHITNENDEIVRTYDSWEELVEAEANGYVATAMMVERVGNSKRKKDRYFTFTLGPYDTKREANNAKQRLKTRDRREYPDVEVLTITVQPAWKDVF